MDMLKEVEAMRNYEIAQSCFILGFAVMLFIGFQWASAVSTRDAQLSAKSECVAKTAKAEGYSGNVYSLEAWQTFGVLCD